ncbi:MAG: glutathione S-transferase N-terminal domain-containing protein [Desulfofustis sp.]|nr:glutathione S-transferase N-terminal domain-containing protein [Desulfofustis sp.]
MELYVRDGCPYCRKVLDAAQQLGLQEGTDYRLIDSAPGTPGRQTVLAVGGTAMVPFLIDGDRSMYESDDIVVYLRERFKH